MWGVKLLFLLFLYFTIDAITAEEIPVSIPDGLIPTNLHDNENLTACDQDQDCGDDEHCFSRSYCIPYEPDHPQHPSPTSNPIISSTAIFETANENLTACTEDQDCGVGEYCLNSYCKFCIPCETNNRHPPLISNSTILVCAKSFEECGPCSPGYEHESLTNGSYSDKCFPKTPSQSTYDDYHWIIDWIKEHIIILICIFWKKLKKLGSLICGFVRTCIQRARNALNVLSAFLVFVANLITTGPKKPHPISTSNEDVELGNTIQNPKTSNGLPTQSEANGEFIPRVEIVLPP